MEPKNRVAALLNKGAKQEDGLGGTKIKATGIMLTQDDVEKMAGMSDGASIDTAGAMVAMLMRPIQVMDHQLMMTLALLMENYKSGGNLGQKKVCAEEYKAMSDAFAEFGEKYSEWTKALTEGLKGSSDKRW